jgi:hypothetical protein
MSSKLSKLADVVRMAARSYDAGKRETAIKLIGTVASKLEFSERQKFLAMVETDISHSGIRVYLRSIIVGHGGSSVISS